MPALRTTNRRATNALVNEKAQKLDLDRFAFGATTGSDLPKELSSNVAVSQVPAIQTASMDIMEVGKADLAMRALNTVFFPTGDARSSFLRKDGKKVTPHQWAVYDFILKIPSGKVSTYKQICDALGEGSPRSVGSALRNNPFAPFVPCHRVIASDLRLGGFFGEWGTENTSGSRCSKKLEMLVQEGVEFTSDGKLKNPEGSLWRIPDA